MSHDKANQSEVGEGPKAVDAELDDAAEDAAKTLELAIAEITKLGETDPKAADAALQRIAHAREAREAEALEADAPEAEAPRAEAPEAETPEAEAPSDIESLEHLLGDLELGADEALEVIEHLDELDAAAEDTAKAKAEACTAAMLAAFATAKIKASVAQELTPALIEQTCGTDGPNTATPAVQVVAVAEKAESPSDVESLAHLLGDLGVGAGESDGAVIEDLSELDAYAAKVEAEVGASEAEDTPKAEGSVAATPAAADGPNTATYAEAAVAEEAERTDIENLDFVLADLEVGAGEVHEAIQCLDEQAIADDHRRAVEAIDQSLRELGKPDAAEPVSKVAPAATEAIDQSEMPAADPLYTGEPLECFDPVGDLKTIRKRARYSGYNGWARFLKDQRQKRWRDNKKAKAPAPIAKPPRFPMHEVALDMRRHLKLWTWSGETHRASALQGHEDRLISALEKYLQMVRVMGRDPSYPEFAKRMDWSEYKARRIINVLRNLFDVGGPWHRP
jgi:hypothetical protein